MKLIRRLQDQRCDALLIKGVEVLGRSRTRRSPGLEFEMLYGQSIADGSLLSYALQGLCFVRNPWIVWLKAYNQTKRVFSYS